MSDDGSRPQAGGPHGKRILLGLLAGQQRARLGLAVDGDRLAATTRWVRARFDLIGSQRLRSALLHVGATPQAFEQQMLTFHDIDRLYEHHAARIDRRLASYRAVFCVRDWLLRREQAELDPTTE